MWTIFPYALTVIFLVLILWAVLDRRALQWELSRTRKLFEVSLQMNSTIKKQDLLNKIMETSANVMDAEASSIILVDQEKGDLYFELAIGGNEDDIRTIRLQMGEGIAGWVARNGESVRIDDAASDPRWSNRVSNRLDYPTRNLICVPVVSKGEIVGVLQVLNKRNGKPFNARDVRLLEAIAAPTAISLENSMLYHALEKSMNALRDTIAVKNRMESELRVAGDIQMSFLPDDPSHVHANESVIEGAQIGAFLRPAKEVGGDFYNYFALDERHLFFTLGDVSDKGIPAALFMAVTISLIKGKMVDSHVSPAQLLNQVNVELCKGDSSMFATIFCGILNTESGQLIYSDGGHCLPYIVGENGSVEPLRGKKGLPLGVMEETQYADNTASLHVGESILLYTDGIIEAEEPSQEQYGSKRLFEYLRECDRGSLPASLNGLVADVDKFSNGAPQSDDIAVLMIKRTGLR